MSHYHHIRQHYRQIAVDCSFKYLDDHKQIKLDDYLQRLVTKLTNLFDGYPVTTVIYNGYLQRLFATVIYNGYPVTTVIYNGSLQS